MSTLSSRALIIERAAKNKPEQSALPDISLFETSNKGDLATFSEVLKNIGGSACLIHDLEELVSIVMQRHPKGSRFYSPVEEIQKLIKQPAAKITDGHEMADVELAIIEAHFAVAENGAVWLTDEQMGNRTLPFICQHLAVIVNENDIVPSMHEAYQQPSMHNYHYGSFIAGPSKTADIEQSLVLGAHGPRSMTVFVILKKEIPEVK